MIPSPTYAAVGEPKRVVYRPAPTTKLRVNEFRVPETLTGHLGYNTRGKTPLWPFQCPAGK